MEQLLSFIETMAIDEKLTWRVNGRRPGEIFEIVWNRRLAPTAWGIRKGFQEQWELFSNADFRLALQVAEIDMNHLEKVLSTSILSQAVFADMVLEQIKEIFGSETVERSVAESRKFLNSITDFAAALGGQPRKEKEKNLINQTNKNPAQMTQLPLVLH